MSKTITIFEDRSASVHLTDAQMHDLLSLESIWGSQNFHVRADNRILLKKYVGFVATPELQLQILPKIYQDGHMGADGETETGQAIRLLFRLLQFSGFISVKELPNAQRVSQFYNNLLEVYISIFLNRFLGLYTHHVHRQYEPQEENMSFIKGKILFQETLLRNVGVRYKHVVSYEEFTEDTLLNQIIKTVIISLRKATKHVENNTKIAIALSYLEDVRTIQLSSTIFGRVRFNRLNHAYRPLFEMAKMFYFNQQPGMSYGDEYTFTFLVPLNQLFEFTLFNLLQRGLEHTDCTVHYQMPQRYLDTTKSFLLKPDITISDNYGMRAIVDAKYKNPLTDGSVKLSQSDVYQLLAYAVRYNCDRIFLVYPKFIGSEKLSNPLSVYQIANQDKIITLNVLQVDLDFDDDQRAANELVQSMRIR